MLLGVFSAGLETYHSLQPILVYALNNTDINKVNGYA